MADSLSPHIFLSRYHEDLCSTVHNGNCQCRTNYSCNITRLFFNIVTGKRKMSGLSDYMATLKVCEKRIWFYQHYLPPSLNFPSDIVLSIVLVLLLKPPLEFCTRFHVPFLPCHYFRLAISFNHFLMGLRGGGGGGGGLSHLPPKFEHIFVAVIIFPPFFCGDTCCLLCVL